MLSAYDERCDGIPHAVLAFIQLEFSRGDPPRQFEIAFRAMPARIRMNPVEFRADILPAHADQHVAFEIDDADREANKLI
jgi:hypothetical protein